MSIKNIVFDFGGVLVDWNPRYLYRSFFDSESEMEFFLENICTGEWNLQQDAGRSLAEGTRVLQDKFPEYHALIQLFYDKWEVMLKSEIPETVELFNVLRPKYNIYGLTNWSAETFPIAYKRYEFFQRFDGIIVSGTEKCVKPDAKLFEILLDRYSLRADECLFIDDNADNICTATSLGFCSIHFRNAHEVRVALSTLGIL